MYSLACSGLNSRRKKREYKGQKSAARSHIVYIGAITHMREATATCSSIIKIDSMYKVCKKLQGSDAHSANMATNVGNERGEILQCVLTTSEGVDSLQALADGLMERYKKHKQPHLLILYTNRDCCSSTGVTVYSIPPV